MNANQLMNMVVRMFVRKVMNFGMKAGMDAMSKRDSAGRARPQEKSKDAKAPPKFDSRQARQMARMTHKIGRF